MYACLIFSLDRFKTVLCKFLISTMAINTVILLFHPELTVMRE